MLPVRPGTAAARTDPLLQAEQVCCLSLGWPCPEKGALAGKRHAGRIERTGKRLTDLSRLSTCRGEGKRKGGEKERKKKAKLDPQHQEVSRALLWPAPVHLPLRPTASLPRAGSTLGSRGIHRQTKACLPQPRRTALGAQGSQGCVPSPPPSAGALQQLLAGEAGTGGYRHAAARWAACRGGSSFPVSRARTVLCRAPGLPSARPSPAARGPVGQVLAGGHNAVTASLPPQTPASVLL